MFMPYFAIIMEITRINQLRMAMFTSTKVCFLKAILRESLNTNNKSNKILRIQMYINMISFGFPPPTCMSCETYM